MRGAVSVAPVLLAELEIRHSRAYAPTRRVAHGELWLPTDPAPGFGGVLLGGIVGGFISGLDDETRDSLDDLLRDLERRRPVVQPRVRFRFQSDVVGLDRSRHQLFGTGEHLRLDLDDHGPPLPQVLGAVYAAAQLSYAVRGAVFRLLRRATRWESGIVEGLVAYLTSDEAAFRIPRAAAGHDRAWALEVLGFPPRAAPARPAVLRRFRVLIRGAHPDHGAEVAGAGARVQELTEAKRILAGA